MKQTVVVGMSGGVDSSVAAYLLKEQGYQVIGVTMLLGEKDVSEDAKAVADTLGISHYTFDFRETFRCHVIDYFVEEYLQARTPNPCIACNRHVKWEALLERSAELGADYVATGHYARIDRLPNGRFAVRNSVTAAKDQTYALYRLTQEQLARTLMPVGEHPKEEVRRIAEEIGLSVANKPDSQEICFVTDGDYAAFIDSHAPGRVPPPGNFVNKGGEVLGRHKGITHYTIGQRRGLEVAAGRRIFVTEIDREKNLVVLGENEDIFTDTVRCRQLHFMGMGDLTEPRRVLAKIRYNHKGEYGVITRTGEDEITCRFEKPVRAATPGQALVFYEGEYVLGGGTIVG